MAAGPAAGDRRTRMALDETDAEAGGGGEIDDPMPAAGRRTRLTATRTSE